MSYSAARNIGIIGTALLAAFPRYAHAADPTAYTPTVPQPSHSAPAITHKHVSRRHHTRIHHRVAASNTPYNVPGSVHPSTPQADRGFVPAPVVPQPPPVTDANANLVPPENHVPTNTDVQPGTMQLHYPFAGNGYVTGSSPQAMDDATTAKIPGVIVNVPLQPKGPQPLPPP